MDIIFNIMDVLFDEILQKHVDIIHRLGNIEKISI